jgi:hypothetical protein
MSLRKEVAAMKRAKILSTGAVQKILDEEMPGFRVVRLEQAPVELQDAVTRKASRSLPSLTKMRQRLSRIVADGQDAEEALWGNSSQFALIEPKGPASSDDTTARRRRTVIVSHGKIITEQG